MITGVKFSGFFQAIKVLRFAGFVGIVHSDWGIPESLGDGWWCQLGAIGPDIKGRVF